MIRRLIDINRLICTILLIIFICLCFNISSNVDIIKKIEKELTLAWYNITISYNSEKIVQYAFVKFEGLMYETGISPHQKQIFSIKIEIDTKQP